MGNERASLAARGVPLAPRGSVRDEALREVLRRERRERFSRVELFARLIGMGLRVPDERVFALLDTYFLELFQERYRPEVLANARATRARRSATDQKLLSRLDKLTVKDGEVPSPGRRPQKKRRRR